MSCSDRAVEGITCMSPVAPASEVALGSKRDSTWATATSIASGRPTSRDARSKAGLQAAGIGHAEACHWR